MPEPDSPVLDVECWFRVITNKSHVTGDGTLHFKAPRFELSDQKPWTHEVSGRLVSQVGTIQEIIDAAEAQVAAVREGYENRGQMVPVVLIRGTESVTAGRGRGGSSR